MKNSDEFYEHNDKIRAGNINDILLLDEYTVIVYRKGLSREEQIEIEDSFRMSILRQKKEILFTPWFWTRTTMSFPLMY